MKTEDTMRQIHTIIGQARIEGTQRGFVVWVKTNKRTKAQLTNATEDYDTANATANSINLGRWVSSRKGVILQVNGSALTVSGN